jgi:hypothetical protein
MNSKNPTARPFSCVFDSDGDKRGVGQPSDEEEPSRLLEQPTVWDGGEQVEQRRAGEICTRRQQNGEQRHGGQGCD